MLELEEKKFDEILVSRMYMIVCYRNGNPCTYQIYDGLAIGNCKEYYIDGPDAQGGKLTYKFFLLPPMVR